MTYMKKFRIFIKRTSTFSTSFNTNHGGRMPLIRPLLLPMNRTRNQKNGYPQSPVHWTNRPMPAHHLTSPIHWTNQTMVTSRMVKPVQVTHLRQLMIQKRPQMNPAQPKKSPPPARSRHRQSCSQNKMLFTLRTSIKED